MSISPVSNRSQGAEMLQPGLAGIESLRSMYSKFHTSCRDPKCGASIAVTDTRQHLDCWMIGAQKIPPASQLSGLSCPTCFTPTCAGCGREPQLSLENSFTPHGVVNSCCQNGRLYSIYLLLSYLDEQELATRKVQPQSKSPSKKKSTTGIPAHLDAISNGIGYAGGWDPYFSHSNHSVPSSAFLDIEEEDADEITVLVLRLIIALLPKTASHESNVLVDDLRNLLVNSLLFDRLAELIRNDSVTDLVARRELYTTAFTLIELLADQRVFQHFLFLKRKNKKNHPGLHALCTNSDTSAIIEESSDDEIPSIYHNGVKLFKQAQALLKMCERNPKGFLDHGKETIRMCQMVVDIFNKLGPLQIVVPRLDSRGPQNTEPVQSWSNYCVENAVTFTDDVLTNHRYRDKFVGMKSANKGRLTAIGREIANLTTSLPCGIFIKVAESRSDVMKILIVGIEGTPYASGLFTFDLFLDANYPTTPPKMSFTLEGNDSEDWSFNPNLHKGTGTVCLSIINTWQGNASEMWQPGKSTILAVLISIQAMILGAPLPWINEPGFAQQQDTPEAHDHKLLIQYKTVRYAMLKWLGATIDPKYTIWDDIRKVYWQHHGLSTLLTVKEWAKTNHMISELSSSGHKSSKKSKRKINTPQTPGGDLLEKLATMLNLSEHLDPKPAKVEEGAASSSRPRRKKAAITPQKGKGKRKHEESSDESDFTSDTSEELSGLDSPMPEPSKAVVKPPSKRKKSAPVASSKAKASSSKGKGKAVMKKSEEPELIRWIYTGGKTQKETRQACTDFEISGAKSIKDTITKLEAYVNDNDLSEGDVAQRWGMLEAYD